jgi:hypothetical protein
LTKAKKENPSAQLLNRFDLMREHVEAVRTENLKSGLDPKRASQYIDYPGSFGEERKLIKFIGEVTNPKRPGVWNQMADLKASGDVPADRETDYDNRRYPLFRLNSLHKIKTQRGIFLFRHRTVYGLTKAGKEKAAAIMKVTSG